MADMFFKKDKALEEYQHEANGIVASLDELARLIEDMKKSSFDSEMNLIQKEEHNKFKSAILALKPMVKTIKDQPNLNYKIDELKNAIYCDFLTIKRNLLLNKISTLQIDLYVICIKAQGLLAQNQHLLNNIPDVMIKGMIETITADKFLETFLEILTAYNFISNSFIKNSNKMLALLQSSPQENYSAELMRKYSQQRTAISIDDLTFQRFEEVIDSFSSIELFLSLQQFIESFPEEIKSEQKQSLSKFWPIINEIEQTHDNLYAHCSKVSSCIETARLEYKNNLGA